MIGIKVESVSYGILFSVLSRTYQSVYLDENSIVNENDSHILKISHNFLKRWQIM